jgi:hypothetical protein
LGLPDYEWFIRGKIGSRALSEYYLPLIFRRLLLALLLAVSELRSVTGSKKCEDFFGAERRISHSLGIARQSQSPFLQSGAVLSGNLPLPCLAPPLKIDPVF